MNTNIKESFKTNTSVQVLLATYNGEKYIDEQVSSLLHQTYTNFTVLVRDDGSSDDTLRKLKGYEAKYPEKFSIVECKRPTGSAKGNFRELMMESNADYVFWCDQDDVWYEKKLQVMLRKIQEVERANPGEAVFAYSDCDLINESSELTGLRYQKYKKLSPKIGLTLSHSLICPASLGCGSGINRRLLELVKEVPSDVTGHDWYAHILALAIGRVAYIDEPLIKYRIHSENVSSPKQVSLASYSAKSRKIEFVKRGIRLRQIQAQSIIEKHGHQMESNSYDVIYRFCELKNMPWFKRKLLYFVGRYTYPDWIRNIATIVFL